MIKMRDLNSGFAYRSAWTGYAKGRGLDINNAPVLHSARIEDNQVYEDPFKGPRHGFSKKYEQFIEALKTTNTPSFDMAEKMKTKNYLGRAD
ncbi:MAG TPA: hypothetical protein VIN05_01255 [Roseovarius sp.]